MKYALLMSGEMRTFHLTVDSIKKYLPHADIYIHTWSTSNDSWKSKHLNIEQKKFNVVEDEIRKVYGKQLKSLIIEDFFKEYNYYNGISFNNCTAKLPSQVPLKRKRYIDQPYGRYRADILRQESNIEYDIIIKSRPDVLFLKKPTINNPGIYQTRCAGYNQKFKLNDYLAWGDPLSMEIYSSMFEQCTEIYQNYFDSIGKLKGAEVMLQEYVNTNGVPVYDVELHGEILRSKDVIETHQVNYYAR